MGIISIVSSDFFNFLGKRWIIPRSSKVKLKNFLKRGILFSSNSQIWMEAVYIFEGWEVSLVRETMKKFRNISWLKQKNNDILHQFLIWVTAIVAMEKTNILLSSIRKLRWKQYKKVIIVLDL